MLPTQRNLCAHYLLQDGEPITQNEAGVDVDFDTEDSGLDVSTPRMYYLLKNTDFGSHLLALEPQRADLVLHSFTYGNNCQRDFEREVNGANAGIVQACSLLQNTIPAGKLHPCAP